MASQIKTNIPATGSNNLTQDIRDNFGHMKEEIEALQTAQRYKRILFHTGYPGYDVPGYEGPRGPHPRGTLWYAYEYGILAIWLGGPLDDALEHWHDVTQLT